MLIKIRSFWMFPVGVTLLLISAQCGAGVTPNAPATETQLQQQAAAETDYEQY